MAPHVPVTAKSLALCFSTPGQTHKSEVLTLETVPWPTTLTRFLTFLGITFIVFLAENPPDCAVIVKTPGVSATNLPEVLINAAAGRPIPYSAFPLYE